MSGPFKVGDVVICVEPGRVTGCDHADPVKPQEFGKVVGLTMWGSVPCLLLEGRNPFPFPGYRASRFRLLPIASAKFIQQMRAIKPVREGVSA